MLEHFSSPRAVKTSVRDICSMQSSSFLYLPEDILSAILHQLRLSDVAKLQQTCRTLKTKISYDKQFWVHVIKEHLHDHGCRLPHQIERRDLGSVEASTVEFWARTVLALDRTYRSSGTNRFSTVGGLSCVTWVKLVRGRWCIVASSDLSRSRIAVFDGLSGLQSGPKVELFLAGPVMDGVVDDNGDGVNMGLSIGTKCPFIQILTIAVYDSTIQILSRTKLISAYCTRFLKDNLIGFAIRNGDDETPCVADWTSGDVWPLCPGVRSVNDGNVENDRRIEPGVCRAMTLYMGCIVVAYAGHLEFFDMPLKSPLKAPCWFASSPSNLQYYIRSASFFTYCSTPSLCWSEGHTEHCTALFLAAQNAFGDLDVIQVTIKSDGKGMHSIHLIPYSNTLNDIFSEFYIPYVVAAGSSGSMFCCVAMDAKKIVKLPGFHLLRIRPPKLGGNVSGSSLISFSTLAPSLGLPLLHMSPCIDFDDGRGVALIGNSIGEICLVEFEGGGVNQRLGLDDELPSIGGFNRLSTEDALSMHSEPLDLPPLYKWFSGTVAWDRSQTYDILKDVPRQLLNENAIKWKQDFAYQQSSPDWSDDWSKFEFASQWLAPVPLWGEIDPMAGSFPISYELRTQYCLFGEPVPLLFNIKDPRVLFRIGSRLFVLLYVLEGDGLIESVFRVYITLEHLRIGNVTNQDIANADIELISYTSAVLESQGRRLELYKDVSNFAQRIGLANDGEVINSWTQERWDYLHSLWEDFRYNRPRVNDPNREQYFETWCRAKGFR